MNAPLKVPPLGKPLLGGICAALLLVAATPGYSQPVPFQGERGASPSSMAGRAAASAEKNDLGKIPPSVVEKTVPGPGPDRLPGEAQSGSLLDGITHSLGIKGALDPRELKPADPEAVAAEHIDRLEGERRQAQLESAATSRGTADPESGGLLQGLLTLIGLQAADDIESPPDSEPWSALEIFALVILAGIGLLVCAAGAKGRATR